MNYIHGLSHTKWSSHNVCAEIWVKDILCRKEFRNRNNITKIMQTEISSSKNISWPYTYVIVNISKGKRIKSHQFNDIRKVGGFEIYVWSSRVLMQGRYYIHKIEKDTKKYKKRLKQNKLWKQLIFNNMDLFMDGK